MPAAVVGVTMMVVMEEEDGDDESLHIMAFLSQVFQILKGLSGVNKWLRIAAPNSRKG